MAYYALAERLRRERVPVAEAIRLILQIARGVGAAHAQRCADAKRWLAETAGPTAFPRRV
jgi:hypothetical protein